ncbi:bifunctional diaminohydroxyphosphoribosylaminopyrimidine deaminase/5-amino-6-(5-phosphoribosylamino)uracil reductase RibD [Paenibacillus turpanensis]|uniref:bifunctional diaminohydroxyphosphoribosylaminopyrimidine deaminase/5-amino-6-(5-phosphoribosylamino)uracil reductase RibD n=1 Tax=Paenibacillus turpanensis TaxID=2689078 RepID=UPI00140B34DC|nr:bifunctional diaminohydroxyphosphoribosylaminopyrimidine deaminase/5-amino-6-(5-phosphoribosylamino)uracil reductase RibD [Paenibacillus turpanensis]
MTDEFYMKLALQMASGALGQTGVNPVVGCVVVKAGRIVGMGAHLKRGEGHAEVHALNMAGAEAEGSTVYVTLEPCSHYGKTPPCASRLVQEKVKRVVIASLDPNPLVAGKGAALLREAGIDVSTGVLAEEASRLNEAFNKYIVHRLPFVTLKTASTLDGKIASRTGDSKWITGEQSRAFVHTLRHRHAGIMVGAGTVLADDPSLTTRLTVPALDPVRIIADSQLRIPLGAKVLQTEGTPAIILTTSAASDRKKAELEREGAVVMECGSGPMVDLKLAMKLLGEREISSILLEGGGTLNGAMLQHRLIDKIMLFFAPKIIGGGKLAPGTFDFDGAALMSEAVPLKRVSVEQFGDDVCIAGYPVYDKGGDE